MSQGKFEDLTGKRFGMLTVLYRTDDYIQPSGQHKRMWHCKCDCGTECNVRAADLKTGNTKSCGCFQQFSRGKSSFEDLTGKTFGRLTVLYRLPNHVTPSGQTLTMWYCKCSCGKECKVYASQLRSGKDSCGCLSIEIRNQKKAAKQLEQEQKKAAKQLEQEQKKAAKQLEQEQKEKMKNALITQNTIERNRIKEEEKIQKKKEYLENHSLAVKCPELIKEWNTDKNKDLSPYDISAGSGKKVWWICSKGHEWQAAINGRVRGNGCPYCSNKYLLQGFNDLATKKPELINEWDYDKNTILPSQIKYCSPEFAWWKCKLGHSYNMRIYSRTGKSECGCPYCSIPAKRVLKGFNDLQSKYPDLAKEWHPTKNGNLSPDSVLCGSAKKVWWIGKCGHEYEQGIVNRVNGGNCPYCSHQKLLAGFNDFATTNPELLNEWDYDKNSFLPSEIGCGSKKKVWWKCPFGHSYQSYPYSRCGSTHSGCPICDKENHTSFPEQALYYYIKKLYPDAINSDRNAIGMELDIYIPSLNIAMEYDGCNWHKNNKFEHKKNKACLNNNILLIRIREEGLELFDDCYCVVRNNLRIEQSLSIVIKEVLLYIDDKLTIDVDVERDASAIYNSYISIRKAQSLLNTYPELALEWHPTKNVNLTADMIAPLSSKKVWWLGKCGHEWQMSVQDRTNQGCGCPICAGKRIVSGVNDLLLKHPELCEEWDYEKNTEIGLFPDKVAPHSDKKAWWICKVCGYSWYSKIDGRTRMKAGCPQCKIKKISSSHFKAVKCVETDTIYNSIKEAGSDTGINVTCIANCCRGTQKTAGGLHWEYHVKE